MKKRWAAALVLALWCLAGCVGEAERDSARQYQVTYWDVFDTVTTLMGYAESEADFQRTAERAHDLLLEYHRLYDIYNDYAGLNNLKTVNDAAGVAPVEVDGRILDLLVLCRELYAASGGKVNAAMGSVLTLWHTAREDSLADPERAYVPDGGALEEAMEHIAFDTVVLDEEASTVYLADGEQRLDVGAVAKGYAAGRVAETLPEGMVLSLGGNVCVTGPKSDGSPWVVGIQDPDGDGADYAARLSITAGAVGTSGDYQRRYTVDGVVYHHIIDPDTGAPGRRWRSVTVVCADSGLADALSTALFLLDREAGEALLAAYDAQACWIGPDGSMTATPGLKDMLLP